MKTQNANVAIVKFTSAKVTNAVEMTPAQQALFTRGEELGASAADSAWDFADALKACKSHSDRLILRAGFVSVYAAARKVPAASAIKKFNRMAAEHAPGTSRKAKSNAKRAKGAGRKEKTATGKVSKLSEKDVQSRLVAALAWTAKQQQRHVADSEVLEMLGELAAILGGKSK